MRCDLSSTRDPSDPVTLRSQVRQNPISPVISPQDGVSRASPVITAKEQLLRDDQAERLDVVERGLTTRVMITREADRGHDPIIEMDVAVGQEGVSICFHTQGLTASAFGLSTHPAH